MAFKVKDLMISVLPGQGHAAGGGHAACKLPVSLPCLGAGGGTIICDDISCGGCSVVTCGGCSVLPHHLTNGCHPCSHCTACSACSACSAHSCGFCSHGGCSFVSCQICSIGGCSHITCGVCSVHSCGICSHGGCSIVISNCGPCSHGGCSIAQVSVCGPLSGCGGTIHCGGTIQCGGSGDPGPIEQVDNLAALKAQLQQALANVEAQEKAAEESMQPKTVAEVDDLTKKLTEALAELKVRKEEIQKQDAAKKPEGK